jgi:hypothetical protein
MIYSPKLLQLVQFKRDLSFLFLYLYKLHF